MSNYTPPLSDGVSARPIMDFKTGVAPPKDTPATLLKRSRNLAHELSVQLQEIDLALGTVDFSVADETLLQNRLTVAREAVLNLYAALQRVHAK